MKRGAKNKAALDLINENLDLDRFDEEVLEYDIDPDDTPEVMVTADKYNDIPDYEEE